MNTLHAIAEQAMKKAGQKGLGRLEGAFLAWHLARCERCREFGLNLAEFLHESDPRQALNRREAGLLHQGIRVALRRLAASEDALAQGKIRPAGKPLVSPLFFPPLPFRP